MRENIVTDYSYLIFYWWGKWGSNRKRVVFNITQSEGSDGSRARCGLSFWSSFHCTFFRNHVLSLLVSILWGRQKNENRFLDQRCLGSVRKKSKRYGFTSRCLRIFNTLLTHCESLDGNLSGLFITLIWLHNNPPYIYVHAHIHAHLK